MQVQRHGRVCLRMQHGPGDLIVLHMQPSCYMQMQMRMLQENVISSNLYVHMLFRECCLTQFFLTFVMEQADQKLTYALMHCSPRKETNKRYD